MAADYAALKTQVESGLDGRTDIPAHVYSLATAEINGMRLLVQQTTATLPVSSEATALPSDFRAIDSAYVDATPRVPLTPSDEYANDRWHQESGRPIHYAIVDGFLRLNPVPDGTYSVVMRYYATLADFINDADTNDVLQRYPALYLYAALKHAAIWLHDEKKIATYAGAFASEKMRVEREDMAARHGRGLVMRADRVG